ncbi:hypothetical protein ASE14_18480 [Agromyces sp. Root81]|uniref:carbohydrate kinase family protein n=1 Tax=Agromyces sp. Root81 TaxID=1736601 RepID=UPI0006FD08A9|nr:carbohydrate kinase family protein [Agromyces sp. Root81]KRC58558.1 hypothetical protein ASE14_18480 [Agromyces sp. Root81]
MNTPRYSVFFGDVAQDEYFAAPYFPHAGDKVVVESLPSQFGGMLANAASIFANYGMPASFMSHLNPGPLSRKLLDQLAGLGLGIEHVVFDERVPDSRCLILLAEDQHIVIIPNLGITHTEITPAAFEHMAGAEFVVTSMTDAQPWRMGPLRSLEILGALRERGAKVVMDLDTFDQKDHATALFDLCDILFMNSLGERRFVESGRDIRSLLDGAATAVVVTRDSDGCELHTRDGVFTVPGFPVDVVDVTGAGDTFSSSFLYAYSRTGDPREAAEFANAAAALSVGKAGARGGMTTRAEVEAFRRSYIRTA